MITLNGFPNNGNLGNQLFQLAAAYGLAKKMGVKVAMPKWPAAYLFPNVLKYVTVGRCPVRINYRESKDLLYRPIPEIDGTSLWGYFQSEKFFEHCKSDVKDMFAYVNQPPSKPANIIALNVRGGDFNRLRGTYTEINAAYYKKAIELSGCDKVHIYTDDEKYAHNLLFDVLTELKVKYALFTPDRDTNMKEMASYHYFANSNSTYSWWAAYLNINENATIYAPTKIFNTTELKSDDYFPSHFNLIDNG